MYGMPATEYLSREETGEQDAEIIAAFGDRLLRSELDPQTANNITYQYALHLFITTREVKGKV